MKNSGHAFRPLWVCLPQCLGFGKIFMSKTRTTVHLSRFNYGVFQALATDFLLFGIKVCPLYSNIAVRAREHAQVEDRAPQIFILFFSDQPTAHTHVSMQSTMFFFSNPPPQKSPFARCAHDTFFIYSHHVDHTCWDMGGCPNILICPRVRMYWSIRKLWRRRQLLFCTLIYWRGGVGTLARRCSIRPPSSNTRPPVLCSVGSVVV